MKQTLIEVLMHIFNQILEDESLSPDNTNRLIEKLEQAGAELHTTTGHNLSEEQVELIRKYYQVYANRASHRLLSQDELKKIGTHGWNFLLSLEQAGVTPDWIRELVLFEVTSAENETISLTELKHMVLQIMQKIIQKEEDLVWLEHYLFANNQTSTLH